MTSLGIIANGDPETILNVVNYLRQLPDLKIIYVKQSEEKLYIITGKAFSLTGGQQ